MKTSKNIKFFDAHLDENYGKVGTENRNKFEVEFETSKIYIFNSRSSKKTTFDPAITN